MEKTYFCTTCNRGPDETEFYGYRSKESECKFCWRDRSFFNKDRRNDHEFWEQWEWPSPRYPHFGYSEWRNSHLARHKKKMTAKKERERKSAPRSLKFIKFQQEIFTRNLLTLLIASSTLDDLQEAWDVKCELARQKKIAADREYRKRKRKDPEWVAKERTRSRESQKRHPRTKKRAARGSIRRPLVWSKCVGICWLCKEPVDPKWWAIDHAMPIKLGGDDSLENLMVTHVGCNLFKHSMHPSELPPPEWFREQRKTWETQDWVQEYRKTGRWAPAACGTERSYSRGCRCPGCKKGHRDYQRELRLRKVTK